MTDDGGIITGLSGAFPIEDIEWRAQPYGGGNTRGLALPYITARAVMDRLDTVCGAGGWHDEYRREGQGWICGLSLLLSGEWVTKEDGAPDTEIEGYKGGISDALKRAGVKWGIGRYLYFLPKIELELEKGRYLPWGFSPVLPEWALTGNGRPPEGAGAAAGAISVPLPFEPTLPPGWRDVAIPKTPVTPHIKVTARAPRPATSAGPVRLPVAAAVPPPASGSDPNDPHRDLPRTAPPFDISQPIPFGKHRGQPWAYLAMGGPDGDRRSYLGWMVRSEATRPENRARAQALLNWLAQAEQKAPEEEIVDEDPISAYEAAIQAGVPPDMIERDDAPWDRDMPMGQEH